MMIGGDVIGVIFGGGSSVGMDNFVEEATGKILVGTGIPVNGGYRIGGGKMV